MKFQKQKFLLHQPSPSSSKTTNLFPLITKASEKHDDGLVKALEIFLMALWLAGTLCSGSVCISAFKDCLQRLNSSQGY
ncbi:hypothetical protein NA56DRAFT_755984 [Hyaloscypha hepaticicola]|uniref:Uncharacterized protein n=1 Tax=Hyaloscypha hepaticicola TaxID=2082293 RepID=A0A2J6PGJ8_9HELO|nr:hypothetical protein NA56DRAFT_755984 [Hyaloscypha hepaticicola]